MNKKEYKAQVSYYVDLVILILNDLYQIQDVGSFSRLIRTNVNSYYVDRGSFDGIEQYLTDYYSLTS